MRDITAQPEPESEATTPRFAPGASRGIRRLAEPLAGRLVRALPGVDVRLVAERGASG